MSEHPWGQTREQISEQRRREQEQRERDLADIDGDINWAYQQMRITEAWLEGRIETAIGLTDTDEKRLDKALVVTRTGFKMLKKVVKRRAPHLDTRAWKHEEVPR